MDPVAVPIMARRFQLGEAKMPQGTPQKKEAKKPKKDAPPKSVRSSVGETAGAVELIQRRRKDSKP